MFAIYAWAGSLHPLKSSLNGDSNASSIIDANGDVPVADNGLSMGVKAYIRSERARALQETTLDFNGLFPKGT